MHPCCLGSNPREPWKNHFTSLHLCFSSVKYTYSTELLRGHHEALHLKALTLLPPRARAQWCAVRARSSLTLCEPVDCSLLGCSIHEIFQARLLKGSLFSTPGHLSDPGIKPVSLALGVFFTTVPPRKPFSLVYPLFKFSYDCFTLLAWFLP